MLGTDWPSWAASDRHVLWRQAASLAKSCAVTALAVVASYWLQILCVAAREESPRLDCSLMQSPFPEFFWGFVHAIRELQWWKRTSGGPAQSRPGGSRFFRPMGSWVLSISTMEITHAFWSLPQDLMTFMVIFFPPLIWLWISLFPASTSFLSLCTSE